MSLLCPKCMNTMRQYERNRIIVDQCTECGGLFLDRGELEALVAAERSYYGDVAGAAPGAPPPPVGAPAPIYDDRRYDDRRYEPSPGDRRYDDRRSYDSRYDDRPRYDPRVGDSDDYYRGRKKRKRSFLEELFDD